MSAISPWPSSSLTRPGRTTSTTGATTVSADADPATAGLARRSAPIACDHRTTGSLSPSSSVSHATGFRAASASRHAARRVVFPKPAGQATRVSLRSDPLRRRSRRRSRRIDCSRTDGGCSFVATRMACPAPRRLPSLAAESCGSEVAWGASGTSLTERPGGLPRIAERLLRRGHESSLPDAVPWVHGPKVPTWVSRAEPAVRRGERNGQIASAGWLRSRADRFGVWMRPRSTRSRRPHVVAELAAHFRAQVRAGHRLSG